MGRLGKFCFFFWLFDCNLFVIEFFFCVKLMFLGFFLCGGWGGGGRGGGGWGL